MPLISQSASRAAVSRTRSTERGQVERRRAASSTRSGSISRQSPNDRRFGSRAPSADDRNPNRTRNSSVPKKRDVSPPPAKRDTAEMRLRKAQQAQAIYDKEERAKQQRAKRKESLQFSHVSNAAVEPTGNHDDHRMSRYTTDTAVSKKSSSQHQLNNKVVAAPSSKFFVMSPEVATAIQMAKLRGGIPTSTRINNTEDQEQISRLSSYHRQQEQDTVIAQLHHHQKPIPLSATPLQHRSDDGRNGTEDGEGFGFSSSTIPQAPPAPPQITHEEIASMCSTVNLCRVIGRHQTYVDDLKDSIAAYETATQEERDSCAHFKHDRATRRTKIAEEDRKRRQRMSVINKQIMILEKENKGLQLQLYDEGY